MKTRLLIVEDSEVDAKLIVRTLERAEHELDWLRVEDEEGMVSALENRSWDLIISDWMMPRFSAPGALEVLRRTDLDIPLIVVSATVGEETAVAAMRAGAQDCVSKQALARLVPVVLRISPETDHTGESGPEAPGDLGRRRRSLRSEPRFTFCPHPLYSLMGSPARRQASLPSA